MTLHLSDILDLRAYERERDARLAEVIAVKKLRRVALGPLASVVFESATTIRHQVQEMVRAERIIDDSLVQRELEVYNPLVPAPGELSLTLFLELTTTEQLREWLPRLVGIERSLVVRIGAGDPAERFRGAPESGHESQLTREDTTAAVHYVKFRLGEALAPRLLAGPAWLACEHPEYRHEATLREDTRRSLVADWS